MKKLFILAATLLLVLGASAASADDISWEEVSSAEGIVDIIAQGDFVSLGIGVKMWVPSVMESVELTQDDTDQGYMFVFLTADDSASLAVQAVNVDGMGREDYMASLKEIEGVTDVSDDTVNGIPVITYTFPVDGTDTTTACMDVFTDAGYVVEISGNPYSDEEFASVVTVVFASLQGE